jgi:hypothetical protein
LCISGNKIEKRKEETEESGNGRIRGKPLRCCFFLYQNEKSSIMGGKRSNEERPDLQYKRGNIDEEK